MQIDFPDVFQPLFTQEARFYVSDGGRGGGRSWSFARALLIQGAQKKLRILCAREYQNSIKDSVKRLLDDQIEALGLSWFYRSTQESLTGINGTEYLFRGLHNNITEIKSTEGVDICWVEEAEKVSEESWAFLIPTIRKAGSKIYITFNPYKEKDPTYQRFIVNPPPGTVRMRAGYRENPWFPEILRAEMEHDKRTNYDRYLWIWEGEPLGISDAQVFKDKFVVEDFDTPDGVTFYHGADWGFAQDPTALIRCFISGDRLYIDQEVGGIGVDIDKTPALFDTIPTAKAWVSYADCARPETISYMNQHGYLNMKPCKKWQGSVEDGIAYLKSFDKIVIHPRCKQTIEEFNLYQYKIDKQSGEILPIVVDKNNHYVDALRYALQPFVLSPSMRFVYNYNGSVINPPEINNKEIIYIGQLIDDGFFRPVACRIHNGIEALAEFSPDQMIDAPRMIREAYPMNPIVWYLDISTKDVFPAYRQAILDQGITLQVGNIVQSDIERPVILNKLFSSGKLAISDQCTRLKSALSSRLFDKSGNPEKGDSSSGHWYCNSLEYTCYRITSSQNI
jgi:phage terminase large subunit